MAQMKEYHSFSGLDITPVFGNTPFGEMQMISYRAEREKAPIHTMGSPDARSIARGKRYITGACVFTVFDRDSLLEAMDQAGRTDVWLSKHETANYRRGGIVNGKYQSAIAEGAYDAIYGNAGSAGGSRGGGTVTANYKDLNLKSSQGIRSSLRDPVKARLADQILPFDIVLVAANEYGHTTKMVIYGVEFTTESGGMSIDDIVIEKQHAFIARSISNWMTMDTWNNR